MESVSLCVHQGLWLPPRKRALDEIEPVLAPESFALEHIPWRAEHIGGDRVVGEALVFALHAGRLGRLQQCAAGVPAFGGDRRQCIGSAGIALFGPDRAHDRAGQFQCRIGAVRESGGVVLFGGLVVWFWVFFWLWLLRFV